MEDAEGRGSSFHIVTLGSCYLDAPGHYSGRLDQGDLLIFTTALPYSLRPVETLTGEQQHLSFAEGAQLAGTGLLCGDVAFHHRGSRYLLAALPPLLIVRYEDAQQWLQPLLQMVVVENKGPGPVSKVVFDRLSELLFIYAVRHYLADRPSETTMLALYNHERLIDVIREIHNQPAYQWSIAELANRANMSRTVLAEKFKAVSGWTVGQYITWWRMQLAWEMLQRGKAMAVVAEQVGYQSEAAFSRAFKKMFDVSPSRVKRGSYS